MEKLRIMGIDPGTAILGYGIIDICGREYLPLDYGCVYTDKDKSDEIRLLEIYRNMERIIDMHRPDHIAVEELFFNKNVKTALAVGQARGVILLLSALKNIKLFSYTPLEVKQGITGYGRADKKQIQEMVKLLLKFKEIPKPDDAADALAVALTHSNIIFNKSLGRN